MSLVSADELRSLASAALQNARVSPGNADCVAAALVAAELDGLASHGLSRLAAYADQSACGKVDGYAQPMVRKTSAAAIVVDAAHGFAFPAIAEGLARAVPQARTAGACVLAIAHSHHAGVLGHHVERIAEAGLIGLGFSNSPVAIAPWGGTKGVFGTNPVAFAAPRENTPPLIIDLSLSKVARGKVMVAAQRGEAIPEGWALDAYGQPTTDATAALAGTMVPVGDAKGAALALMVEVLAASLTGSGYAFEASSFFDNEGSPPNIGQSFILIDPSRFAGANFAARLDVLLTAIGEQSGTRIPGVRRRQLRDERIQTGIEIDDHLSAAIRRRAEGRPILNMKS
jgi:(2R)-3-sulfolactate dehydrogenase (NADP+)